MGKITLVLIFTLLSVSIIVVSGQDYIIKTDGSEIKSKVVEILEYNIKYYLSDSPEGPIRNIKISDVFMIIYNDGKRETFNAKPETKVTYEQNAENTKISVQQPIENNETLVRSDKKEISSSFIFGGKAGIYIPFTETVSEIYGPGFIGGLVLGYWHNKAGIEIDFKVYSKKGNPYEYGAVDESSSAISIMPLTLTGYWSYISSKNHRTYGGAGLGVCFIKEELTMTGLGETTSGSGSLTALEIHLTGGIRFKPFYFEVSLSDDFFLQYDESWSGMIITAGLFF